MNRITRSIILFFNLSVAFLLMLASLGAYISPVHINFLSFLGFIFPFLWISNVAFAIFWMFKKRKRLIISLSLVILTLSQWNAVFQLSNKDLPTNIDKDHTITVMSYNVRMFDKYVWTKDKETPKKIYQFIKDQNPDILCIQEFYINNKKNQYSENNILSKFKQYKYKHLEYNIKTKSGRKYGLATFSKYPITSTKPLHFENTTNFSIQTDIDINGKHVRIFNNHLESIRLQKENYNFIDSLEFKNDQERRKGIYDIFSKLKHAFANRSYQAQTIGRHIKNSPFPAIVCGDFNDTPISYVYRTVKGDLKDSFIESGGGFGGTYNGNLPSFRIDFIFHDKSFESFNHKRIKVNYSDHYPIKTTLKLPL